MDSLDLHAVRRILQDCAGYLAPLFRLDNKFSFEFELDAQKHLRINYFFDTRYRNYEYFHLDDEDPHSLFEQASRLSLGMYGIINPEVSQKYDDYNDANLFVEGQEPVEMEMDELEQREYEAYQTLFHIVETCSGLAYCAARGVSGYEHIKREERKSEITRQRMLYRQERRVMHEFIQRIRGRNQLADTLYRRYGEEIITRLSPLPFQRARERIVSLTGVDILVTDGRLDTSRLEPLFDRAVN